MFRILLLCISLFCYSCPQTPVALVISDFQLHVCNSEDHTGLLFCILSLLQPWKFFWAISWSNQWARFFPLLWEKADLPDVQNKKTCFLYFFKWIQTKGYISSLLTHFDQKWKSFNRQLSNYFISVCWNFHLFKSTRDTKLHCICLLMSVTNPHQEWFLTVILYLRRINLTWVLLEIGSQPVEIWTFITPRVHSEFSEYNVNYNANLITHPHQE